MVGIYVDTPVADAVKFINSHYALRGRTLIFQDGSEMLISPDRPIQADPRLLSAIVVGEAGDHGWSWLRCNDGYVTAVDGFQFHHGSLDASEVPPRPATTFPEDGGWY